MGALSEQKSGPTVLSTLAGAVQALRGPPSLTAEEKALRRAAKHKDKEIDSAGAKENSADEEINKLLMIGIGKSGKNELFRDILQGSMSVAEVRKSYVGAVHKIVIDSMKALSAQSERYGSVETSAAKSAKRFVDTELKANEQLDEHLASVLYRRPTSLEPSSRFRSTPSIFLTESTR